MPGLGISGINNARIIFTQDFEFMDMAQSPVIKISGYQILQTTGGVVIMPRLLPDIRVQEPHRKTLCLIFIEL